MFAFFARTGVEYATRVQTTEQTTCHFKMPYPFSNETLVASYLNDAHE